MDKLYVDLCVECEKRISKGNDEEVLNLLNRAININKDNYQAYMIAGNYYAKKKQYSQALTLYKLAYVRERNTAKSSICIGSALFEIGDLLGATKFYLEAEKKEKNNANLMFNLGIVYQQRRIFNKSIEYYNKALTNINNKRINSIFLNKGIIYSEIKDYEKAYDNYKKIKNLSINNPEIAGTLLMMDYHLIKWAELSKKEKNIVEKFEKNILTISPFTSLNINDNEYLTREVTIKWVTRTVKLIEDLGPISKRAHHDRIKLGFYSADLWFHPVSLWLAEQVERHDKTKFELYAFNFNPKARDPMTLRLEAAFDHVIPVETMSDVEVAKLSRDLEIDIALDLGGHTHGSRPGIFAARAAPIQISHLGNPGTTGSDYIDYLITDKHALPESSQQFYTEKILYVPCQYTYDTKRQLSQEPMSRADFGLPDNGFVYTCQNNIYKLRPDVFDIWMRLLQKVPGSVLWLMQPNATALANLRKEAKNRGVDPDRLVFTKREVVPADQEYERIGRYLASYKLADLFLDTLPYNAGTTAIDALWAGLPVITQTGNSLVGRMATSALHAIEMPELITKTKAEYEELALELAIKPQLLKQIKEKLEKKKNTTALFAPETNIRHIEEALLMIYMEHLNV